MGSSLLIYNPSRGALAANHAGAGGRLWGAAILISYAISRLAKSTADAMAGAAKRPATDSVCSVDIRQPGIQIVRVDALDVKNRIGNFFSYIELDYSSRQAGLKVPPCRQRQ